MIPAALGGSTTAIALPALAGDLGLSSPQAAWVLAAYVLAQAMCVAIFGRVGDLHGGRAVLIAAAVLAGAGTLAAFAAGSFPLLVAGRLAQGAGAGAAWVAALGIVAARHAGGDRARALGVATAAIGIVSGAGSLIGGGLTDLVGWRAVVAIPALVLVPLLPALRVAPAPTAAVAALAVHMRRRPAGFVRAAVVRSRVYVLGAFAALALCAGYFGMLFSAPLLLLQEHDWSAAHIGVVLVPAAAVAAVAAQVAGRRFGGRDTFRLGAGLAALSTCGLLVGAVADGSPAATVLALGLVLTAFTAGQVTFVSRVPLVVAPEVRSVAAGLFTLVTFLGGAIGTAIVAGLPEPLGLVGALACVAALPLAGLFAALAAGSSPSRLAASAG